MEGAEEESRRVTFTQKEIVMYRFHLSYNDQTGALRIDETGATISTPETEGYVDVYRENDLLHVIKIAGFIQGYNYANKSFVPAKFVRVSDAGPLIINLAD